MTLWIFQNVACFSAPYTRSFVAPRCSAAYGCALLSFAALVVLPLVACFASESLWIKEGFYHEQPLVNFSHGLFVALAGPAPGVGVGWSSSPGLDALLPPQVRVPAVRSTPRDSDGDGVADVLQLVVDVPAGNASKGFLHLTLLATYRLQLRQRVRGNVSAMAVLSISSPFPATGVWARGQLRLRQSQPFKPGALAIGESSAADPLDVRWSSSWLSQHEPLRVQDLLGAYASRNETANVELSVPPVWDYAPRDSFRVEVTLDVPSQPVHYVPGMWEVLKFAWVQYVAFLVPIWWVLDGIRTRVYGSQMAETYVVSGLPAQHCGAPAS